MPTANSQQLTAIVLCGGKSTRMGSDKGLLMKDGKIWARHISDLFIELKIPYVVSCRTEQVEEYKKYFPHNIIITDKFSKSEPTIKGPLNGILSAHNFFTEKNLLVIACDMIQMSVMKLKILIQIYETENLEAIKSNFSNPTSDIFCFRLNDNSFVEPLCAIYSRKVLQKILSDFNSGKVIPESLQNIIKTNCSFIISTNDNFAFSNFNYPI